MLSPTEKALLQELLEVAPLPAGTLTYHELMGFMFGLAITPAHIDRDEWLDAVFGQESCDKGCCPGDRPISRALTHIYSAFLAQQEQGQLHFPYPIETLKQADIDEVREWVSGLEEAFSLCPDVWDPQAEGNFADFSDSELEELFFCMMVIQGLADPVEVRFFLERIPDEVFHDLFAAYDLQNGEKDRNFQALLLGALPLAVQALQNFSQKVREFIPEHALPTSSSVLDSAGPGNIAKAVDPRPAIHTDSKKSKIIQVDFTNRAKISRAAGPFYPEPQAVPCYQLKISLKEAKPPIWRRVMVPGSITLAQLHLVIQLSMGWLNAHLHQFTIREVEYGPSDDASSSEHQLDESAFSLHSVAQDSLGRFEYTYDFGDYWQHQIQIEKRLSQAETGHDSSSPRVIKGKRACPPENIGGIWGYQEFLEAYTDPSHDDHATMVAWAGPEFRPDLFGAKEIEEVNRMLSAIHSS